MSQVLGSPKAGENNLPARANKFLPVLAVASSKKELSPPQARQSHGGLSEKKNINLCGLLRLQRRKNNQPVSRVVGQRERAKNNLPASGLPVLAAASRKQQNNESTCLRKPGKQTTNLRGLFRGKKQNKNKNKKQSTHNNNNQPNNNSTNKQQQWQQGQCG